MSKPRIMAKGHELGPYYTQHVETMGESEGFGSSGRVYTSRTLSGDSYLIKNKSVPSNPPDNYSVLNIPIQVLSLSTMPHFERKELVSRLRIELKQVQFFQKKIMSLNTTQPTQSPSSDIHSCSDGKQKMTAECALRTTKSGSSRGRKRGPSVRDGPNMKHGSYDRFESFGRSGPIKRGPPSNVSSAVLMKQCEILLKKIMSHKYSHVFNQPVDAVLLGLPDYHTIIKHPMDFGTIKSKILSGRYSSPRDFLQDVRLTFSNAMTYNAPSSDVYIMSSTLQKLFEARWRSIDQKLPPVTETDSVPRSVIDLETEAYHAPPLKKSKPNFPENKVKADPAKRAMSMDDKHALSLDLEKLLLELPENIIELLKANSSAGLVGEEELEVDIDKLSDSVLFQLRKLIDDYLLEKHNKGEKVDSCKGECVNDLQSSKSLPHSDRGTDLVDEDVDIGGNDPLPLCYPPVVIEKDMSHRNSKLNGSSSSSSESGSSSSDSDSGSSSGNESGGAKGPVPVDRSQNVPNLRAEIISKDKDIAVFGNGRKLQDGLVEAGQQNSKPVLNWAKVDGSRDGERAPSERQASPEKLYRAALLRNRFADTIIKAQEKNIGKNERVATDPEKQRLEREERERKQREEKARLQAEADAAKAARRKMEEEMARRKRETEREAARLALQKMERTVEMGEGCSGFMEKGREEGVSIEGLGGFGFSGGGGDGGGGGNNPLEQLGLFIKVDEDDEDDAHHPLEDPEDGEIHL